MLENKNYIIYINWGGGSAKNLFYNIYRFIQIVQK